MPTSDQHVGLDRAVFVLRVRRLLRARAVGIGDAIVDPLDRLRASPACGARPSTGLPRHSTVIFWPGSSLLMSTSTGAPAAFARSDGNMLTTNGTAAAPAATPLATVVAVRRKRRFRLIQTLSQPWIVPELRKKHPF